MLFIVLSMLGVYEIVDLSFNLLQNALLILIYEALSELILEDDDLPERVVHQLLLS
jgi:hypothetical protein